MKIVVATHNREKLAEIEAIFRATQVELVDLDDYPTVGPIEETGTTLVDNALIKARTVHDATGLPAIADDTGLEVDALDGAPGVWSARFSGPNATYAGNVALLLEKLKAFPEDQRAARFRTVAAFVDATRELTVEGIVEGWIEIRPRGTGGFGYDSVFKPEGQAKTFAEMSMLQKESISHRGRAFRSLQEALAFDINPDKQKEMPAETH